MIINIHAGHNPDNKIACGCIGILKESTEARAVKDIVIRKLTELGHTVYDCTCDNGNSQDDVLKKIVEKCNEHIVDLDISIHFNCCVNDQAGDDKTTGTEIYIYDNDAGAYNYAINIINNISNLGFTNRGVKVNKDLYVLRETIAPALLIECCFVDDIDDVNLYNREDMATAIVNGIISSLNEQSTLIKIGEISITQELEKILLNCQDKKFSILLKIEE